MSYPHEFLGRCATCLNNAILSSESCQLGYGNGMPLHEDECLIRLGRKAYEDDKLLGKEDGMSMWMWIAGLWIVGPLLIGATRFLAARETKRWLESRWPPQEGGLDET